MTSLTRKLSSFELDKYTAHLIRLTPDDRYLRFGYSIDDQSIIRYVDGQYRIKQVVLAVFDDDKVVAAVEIVFDTSKYVLNNDVVELGLSVETEYRGRGFGGDLFKQAIIIARNRRVTKLISHCLAKNRWMMKIAAKHGMTIERDSGDAVGTLALPPGDLITVMGEVLGDGMALWDYANIPHSLMFNPGFMQVAPSINCQ